MKRFIMVSAVVLIGLCLAMPVMAAKEGPVRIGVIDIQKIMRESKAAKNARAVFLKDLEAKRAILTAKEKEIRLMEEELKNAESKLSSGARREKAEKIAREIKELKRLGADLEEELKRKDAELTGKLIREIIGIVRNISQKEDYTVILEKGSVIAADDATDITDKIIRLYDAQKK